MNMKCPIHPGSLVREDCINELGLTITAAAAQLGVTRQTLSNLMNEKTSLFIQQPLLDNGSSIQKAAVFLKVGFWLPPKRPPF